MAFTHSDTNAVHTAGRVALAATAGLEKDAGLAVDPLAPASAKREQKQVSSDTCERAVR